MKKLSVLAIIASGVFGISTAAAAPITLTYSTFSPATSKANAQLLEFLKNLEEKSEDNVKIKFYTSETLGKAIDHLSMVEEGTADIVSWCPVYTPSRFPLTLMMEMPLIGTTALEGKQVWDDIFNTIPELQAEFDNIKILAMLPGAPNNLFARKPIKKIEDFKGKRIIGNGKTWVDTWKALGAQNVYMGMADMYLGLQRGTIDAALSGWSDVETWKWREVAPYATDFPMMGGYICGMAMNKNSWNRLPENIQDIWDKEWAKFAIKRATRWDVEGDAGRENWVEKGGEIVYFSDTDIEKIAEKAIDVWKDWINTTNEKELPGTEMYEAYRKSMEKHGYELFIDIAQ